GADHPDIVLVMGDGAGERGVRRARAAAQPEHARNTRVARETVDDGELGYVVIGVAGDLTVNYRQFARDELIRPVEGPKKRGVHRAATRFCADREILGGERTANVDRVRRPFRPLKPWHGQEVTRPFGSLPAIGPDLLDAEGLQIRK